MNKFINFLNGGNTIAISGARDFSIIKSLCKKVGIKFFENAFWKKPEEPNVVAGYWDLLYLAQMNHCAINHSTILIEYQVGKGLGFGYKSFKESEDWYGVKPFTASEVKKSVDTFEEYYG